MQQDVLLRRRAQGQGRGFIPPAWICGQVLARALDVAISLSERGDPGPIPLLTAVGCPSFSHASGDAAKHRSGERGCWWRLHSPSSGLSTSPWDPRNPWGQAQHSRASTRAQCAPSEGGRDRASVTSLGTWRAARARRVLPAALTLGRDFLLCPHGSDPVN